MKLAFIFGKREKEQSAEEQKKETIIRLGSHQLYKLFRMGIHFPISVTA